MPTDNTNIHCGAPRGRGSRAASGRGRNVQRPQNNDHLSRVSSLVSIDRYSDYSNISDTTRESAGFELPPHSNRHLYCIYIVLPLRLLYFVTRESYNINNPFITRCNVGLSKSALLTVDLIILRNATNGNTVYTPSNNYISLVLQICDTKSRVESRT